VWRDDPVRVVGVPVIVREVRVCQRLLAFAVGVLAQLDNGSPGRRCAAYDH
jgi:hypothetical protein